MALSRYCVIACADIFALLFRRRFSRPVSITLLPRFATDYAFTPFFAISPMSLSLLITDGLPASALPRFLHLRQARL